MERPEPRTRAGMTIAPSSAAALAATSLLTREAGSGDRMMQRSHPSSGANWMPSPGRPAVIPGFQAAVFSPAPEVPEPVLSALPPAVFLAAGFSVAALPPVAVGVSGEPAGALPAAWSAEVSAGAAVSAGRGAAVSSAGLPAASLPVAVAGLPALDLSPPGGFLPGFPAPGL